MAEGLARLAELHKAQMKKDLSDKIGLKTSTKEEIEKCMREVYEHVEELNNIRYYPPRRIPLFRRVINYFYK